MPRVAAATTARGQRILVVDGDADLRAVLSEQLTEAGYIVTACADGPAALEALAGQAYDAVLSDIRMQGIEGLSLARAVRAGDLDLPVVLLTGIASLDTAVEAVEWGALDYLIKPLSADKLLEVTRRAVQLGVLARLKRNALIDIDSLQLIGDRAELEASFARALTSLWMAAQPIVRANDFQLAAHEVLVRTREFWLPHPAALFAAAERLGRLQQLGRAIREAVATLMATGALPGAVFVNVHPQDLEDPSLVDPGAPLSRFAPRVVLEITERASLSTVAGVSERVAELRRMGYRIAIDDLGAGYAGFASFAVLSPDIVKIDVGLIRDLDSDPLKQKLVGSIASLCRELGILVVAEGVETAGESTAAARAGCDLLQGFRLGVPAATAA